jgi:hypothetical protein
VKDAGLVELPVFIVLVPWYETCEGQLSLEVDLAPLNGMSNEEIGIR